MRAWWRACAPRMDGGPRSAAHAVAEPPERPDLVLHHAALEAEMAQQEGVVAHSRAAHEEVAEALQARRAALTRCDEAMAAATAERQACFIA